MIPIVYEDESIVAVDKPAGLLVIQGRGEQADDTAQRRLEARFGRKLFVVHRLDRDASGVLVFAKTPECHAKLSLSFERRAVKKLYLAAVLGEAPELGTIDLPIQEFGSGRMGVKAGGKPCQTGFRRLEELRGATLVECAPRTGRRHQLRVHLYAIGHPILGDAVYGQERPVGGAPRLMLHALSLEFPGESWPVLRAEPGADFEAALASFR